MKESRQGEAGRREEGRRGMKRKYRGRKTYRVGDQREIGRAEERRQGEEECRSLKRKGRGKKTKAGDEEKRGRSEKGRQGEERRRRKISKWKMEA